MNSEKSAYRRKPGESNDIGSITDQRTSRDNEINQCINQNGEMVEKYPSSPIYRITASCAKDMPNYLVFQKVSVQNITFYSPNF